MGQQLHFLLALFCFIIIGREVLSCNPGWSEYDGKCYKVSSTAFDLQMARRYCQLFQGDLAHAEKNSTLLRVLRLDSSTKYWLREDSGKLSSPNDAEGCPSVYQQAIEFVSCTESHSFICELPLDTSGTTCPGSWSLYGTTCYKAMESAGSYLQAISLCSLQKAKLAVLDDGTKENGGQAAVAGLDKTFLVGAKRKDGVFAWSGSKIFHPSCATCVNITSNGDCLGLMSSITHPTMFTWESVDCNGSYPFLCEMEPTTITTTPQPPSTAAPLLCPIGFNWKSFKNESFCYWETTYETERLNWFQARQFCHAYKGDLASYRSSEEENIGLGGAKGHYRGLWFGLERSKDNIFRWVDGTDLTYSNWDTLQPNLTSKSKYCAIHGAGTEKWALDYCGTRRWFVCKAPKVQHPVLPVAESSKLIPCNFSDPSKHRDEWYLYDGHCYLVNERASYSWNMALNFCRDNNAHLASIHSFNETDFILLRISLSSNVDYWTGLSARNYHSSMTWSDGTPVDFIYGSDNFFHGRNTSVNNCISFNRQRGFWSLEHCNRLMGVICKRSVNSSYEIPTPEPTVTLPGNCESGWYALGNQCYKVFGKQWTQRQTWSEAQDKCKADGANLVSIHNQEQQDFLTDLILDLSTPTVWIGLRNINKGTVFKWSDDSDLEYTNWDSNSPSYSGNQEEDSLSRQTISCITLKITTYELGNWMDVSCGMLKYPYICQKPKNSSLPQPSEDPFRCTNITGWLKLGSSCFRVFEEKLSWIEAQGRCRTFNADLINVRNTAVSIFIKKRISKSSFYWIGVKETAGSRYSLLDGRIISYTNWLPYQPSKVSSGMDNCVGMNSDAKWIVKSCREKNSFICEWTQVPQQEKKTEKVIDDQRSCPNGSNWIDLGSDACYYLFYPLKLSWNSAMGFCLLHGGHLASFHSSNELALVMQNLIEISGATSVHIGLVWRKDDSYAWVDGSPVDFSAWQLDTHTAAKRCVELNVESGKWSGVDCDTSFRNFLCSSPKILKEVEIVTSAEDNDSGNGLSTGGIFAIIACLVVLAVVVVASAYYLCPLTRMRIRLLDSASLEH